MQHVEREPPVDWEAMSSWVRWAAEAALGLALAVVLAGCGTPGAPLPPSLNLPDRVTDLSAARVGSKVSLSWTVPKKSTDKLILKDAIVARVCRREGSGVCVDAGTLSLAPGADATWSETLPQALDQGAPRLLSYLVELKSKQGRSAGMSNDAVVLAGVPPAPVEGFSAEVHKAGIVLHWTPDRDTAAIRLRRTLLTPPATKPQEGLLAPPPEPSQQNLLIEDAHQGSALDKSIRFGEAYEYRAQRVTRVTVDGKTLELEGELSAAVEVDAKDVFPPAMPTGLVAVAMRAENGNPAAIDLSWEPDAENDVAGYIVYRRTDSGGWGRISPAEPLVGPAFHDAQVEAGHTYHYAVSAIGQNRHESERSAETEESLPQP
jgi:hypothetical protein